MDRLRVDRDGVTLTNERPWYDGPQHDLIVPLTGQLHTRQPQADAELRIAWRELGDKWPLRVLAAEANSTTKVRLEGVAASERDDALDLLDRALQGV